MWVRIDDQFTFNPKVVAAGNEAAGAYVRLLAYCGAHLTDGVIPAAVAGAVAEPELLERLEDVGLIRWGADGGLDVEIPEFLEFNPSRDEVEAKRKSRAEAGRRGGLAKARGKATAKANARGRAKQKG